MPCWSCEGFWSPSKSEAFAEVSFTLTISYFPTRFWILENTWAVMGQINDIWSEPKSWKTLSWLERNKFPAVFSGTPHDVQKSPHNSQSCWRHSNYFPVVGGWDQGYRMLFELRNDFDRVVKMFHLKTLGLLLRNKEFLHPNFFCFFALLLTLISWFPMTSQKYLAFHVCRSCLPSSPAPNNSTFCVLSCSKPIYKSEF